MKGIIGRKIGMTRVICPDSGKITPVTLLEAPEVLVLQVKNKEKDGYDSVVLAGFERNKKRKNQNKNYQYIREIPLDNQEIKKGDKISLSDFEGIDFVNLTGVSKGKGFTGVIKRYNFSRGPETHGSHHHREPGSIGTCAKPARVLKGRKLPGRHGNAQISLRKIKVIKIDKENNLMAIQGPVPGSKNSFIFIHENK